MHNVIVRHYDNYGEPFKIEDMECFLAVSCFFTTMPALTQLQQQHNCWMNVDGKFFVTLLTVDLAPSDFQLFPKLKEFLGRKHFTSDDDVKTAVNMWLNTLAAEEYNRGILKLVDRYDKCLNGGGDYVEK
jgi:hypothetical protein